MPNRTDQDIVVVSGLPRSGTSLMMQMLEAGGVPPLSDALRISDQNNPRGYYEYEPVKSLKKDNTWLALAKGKAVKVILPLLPALPADHRYWVVQMQRPVSEVIASQRAMLAELGKAGGALSDADLARVYERQMSQIQALFRQRPGTQWLEVSHGEALSSPLQVAEQVADFIDPLMNRPAMAAVVDPKLYRSRATTPGV